MPALSSALPVAGAALVGAVLLLAGLVKALDAVAFVKHLTRFPGLPGRLARRLGPLLLAGECTLGAALAVGLWPPWVRPIALAVLLGFAAVLAWGLYRGEVEECGCYGGLIRLTIPQSLTLDGIYIVLVGGAWLAAPEGPDPGAFWKLVVTAAAGLLAAALAVASWRRARSGQRPLLNRSPIREGEHWRSEWLGHPERYRLALGAHLVVFLSMDCSQCHTWMGLLHNAVHPHPELPQVLGVFDLPPDQLADLQEILGIPITALGSLATRRLTWTMPFGVLVEDGIVREVWGDVIPEAFIDRIRALVRAA